MAYTYTSRFWAAASAVSGSINVFTVPGDAVYVLRDLVLDNQSAALIGANVKLHSQGAQYWLFRGELQPFTSMHLDLRQVLKEGEVVEINGIGGGWTSLGTGYRLTLP